MTDRLPEGACFLVILLWAVFAGYCLIVLAWLRAALWARHFRADHVMQMLPRPDDEPDAAAPSLMIYIAAHNEEQRIEPCLKRLLTQNYGNLRITVVNDRSDDRTGEPVRALMAKDARISLVDITELPAGWIGKTHALAVATKDADADYLLFADCDCRLAPGTIAAVMKKVADGGLDFLSLWPRLHLETFWERLLTPVVGWLLGLWTVWDSRDAQDGSQVVLGNGQFMLFSRRAYEKIGGHAAARSELAEDIVMARRVGDAGFKRWGGWGKGLYASTRSNDFRGTVNASTRVVIGTLASPRRVFISSQLLSGGIASPLNLGLPALVLGLFWPSIFPLWGICALAVPHTLLIHRLITRIFQQTFEPRPSVLTFILGGQICWFLLLRASWVITGRGHVQWGKTTYRVRGSRIVDVLPEAGPSTQSS